MPETLRTRCPPRQPELWPGNTCWLHSRPCRSRYSHSEPGTKVENSSLLSRFPPWVPSETDPLPLCSTPGEVRGGGGGGGEGQFTDVTAPRSAQGETLHGPECAQEPGHLGSFPLPGTCTCKTCAKHQGMRVTPQWVHFFLPRETSYGDVWLMSHWEGF